MINKIGRFLSHFDLQHFAIVNNEFEILSKSDQLSSNISTLIKKIAKSSPSFHKSSHFERIDGHNILTLTVISPTKIVMILFFPSYQAYLTDMHKIVTGIYYLISLSPKPKSVKNILKDSLEKKSDYPEQKRQLELYFSHAVRNCDYKRIDILIMKLWDFSFCKSEYIKNTVFLKNCIISLIGILTRIVINKGVDTSLVYKLSDHYMSRDYSSIINVTHELVREIVYDFTQLIENTLYKFNVPIIDNAIIFIRRNIYSIIYISDVAKECGVTPEYLSSYFKKVTGINVKQFLQKEKLNEAKFLLISTDMSIGTIAYKLGYSSQSHFSKIFKENLKTSPSQFRKEKI